MVKGDSKKADLDTDSNTSNMHLLKLKQEPHPIGPRKATKRSDRYYCYGLRNDATNMETISARMDAGGIARNVLYTLGIACRNVK